MPTTTPWAIPYPDGPTNLTALQSHFANIANAVNTALTTGLGGAPRIANSDAERLTLFPAAVQGNAVVRPDKGWTEQYYGLYNISTNPSGATPAGWYPISGSMPAGTALRSTTANTLNVGWVDLSATTWWTQTLAQNVAPYNAGWTVPVGGLYQIDFAMTVLIGSAIYAGVSINVPATSRAVLVTEGTSGSPYFNIGRAVGSTMIKLSAGDVLKIGATVSAASTPWETGGPAGGTGLDSGHFAFRYISPPK